MQIFTIKIVKNLRWLKAAVSALNGSADQL
jgi:hypothetical protein